MAFLYRYGYLDVEDDKSDERRKKELPSKRNSDVTAETFMNAKSSQVPAFKKQVRFSKTIRNKAYLSREDFSDKEKKRCWYTESDLIRRHAKLDLAVLKLEKLKSPKKDETFRGLEYLAKRPHAKAKERRVLVTKAVLEEQQSQREANQSFDDQIALASIDTSRESLIVALKQAMSDMNESFHRCDNSETLNKMAKLRKHEMPFKIQSSFQIEASSLPARIPASPKKTPNSVNRSPVFSSQKKYVPKIVASPIKRPRKKSVPKIVSPIKRPQIVSSPIKGRSQIRRKDRVSPLNSRIPKSPTSVSTDSMADPPGLHRRFTSIRLDDAYPQEKKQSKARVG